MDTWYRGEGVGVPAATLGSTPAHDLGDGMYLTDSPAVAQQYAALRASAPASQRVYAVDLDPRAYRVLDLTRDPRWQQFMRPLAPGMPSNETLIKQANENYGKFFTTFVRTNKIDLGQYDAVVGPEYVRGGRQMCVLFKGGRPAPLQQSIRAQFRVVPTAGTTPTRLPVGALTFRGKIGPGLRVVGQAAAVALASALIAFIDAKLRERFAEGEFRKLEPVIEAEVRKHLAEVADIQVRGRQAYANITIEVATVTNNLGTFTPAREPAASYPLIELRGVAVSDANRSGSARKNSPGFVSSTEVETHLYSVPVTLSQEEVALYDAYRRELLWYDEVMRGPLVREDLQRLTLERDALLDRLAQAFAPTAL